MKQRSHPSAAVVVNIYEETSETEDNDDTLVRFHIAHFSSFAYTCLQHILDHHLAGCIAICVTYMWAMSTTDIFIVWTVQFHNFIQYLLGCTHFVRVWYACVSECTNIMYIIASKYEIKNALQSILELVLKSSLGLVCIRNKIH